MLIANRSIIALTLDMEKVNMSNTATKTFILNDIDDNILKFLFYWLLLSFHILYVFLLGNIFVLHLYCISK